MGCGKVCGCAPVFNFVSVALQNFWSWKYGQIWVFFAPQWRLSKLVSKLWLL